MKNAMSQVSTISRIPSDGAIGLRLEKNRYWNSPRARTNGAGRANTDASSPTKAA